MNTETKPEVRVNVVQHGASALAGVAWGARALAEVKRLAELAVEDAVLDVPSTRFFPRSPVGGLKVSAASRAG